MNKDINKQLQTVVGNLIGKKYFNETMLAFQEPTLNDVLSAIGNKKNFLACLMNTQIMFVKTNFEDDTGFDYDLTKSIFSQSEETKLAILKLLE